MTPTPLPPFVLLLAGIWDQFEQVTQSHLPAFKVQPMRSQVDNPKDDEDEDYLEEVGDITVYEEDEDELVLFDHRGRPLPPKPRRPIGFFYGEDDGDG